MFCTLDNTARNAQLDALEYGVLSTEPDTRMPSEKELIEKYWELLRSPDCPGVDTAVLRFSKWLKDKLEEKK